MDSGGTAACSSPWPPSELETSVSRVAEYKRYSPHLPLVHAGKREEKGRSGRKGRRKVEEEGRGSVCSEHALSHAQPGTAKDTSRTTHREEERMDYIMSPRGRLHVVTIWFQFLAK